MSLLKSVFKKEGIAIVRAIVERINKTQKISKRSSTIKTLEDLTEVSSMWETAVKKHDEKGIEKAKIDYTLKMIKNGIGNALIRDVTGLSIKTIQSLRKSKS